MTFAEQIVVSTYVTVAVLAGGGVALRLMWRAARRKAEKP